MSGTQIRPGEIPGTDVVPEAIAVAAAGYRVSAAAIQEKSTMVVTTWSGLSAVYVAPDATQLLASMGPVATDAHLIADKLTRASGFIEVLAESVVSPVRRLKELEIEAEAFVASVKGGVTVGPYDPDNTVMQQNAISGSSPVVIPEGMGEQTIPWDQHSPSVARNNELLEEVNQQVAILLQARAECVNGINALRDDMCVVSETALTEKELNAATDLTWGSQGKGDRSCSESVGDGLADFGSGLVNGVLALIGHNAESDTWTPDYAGAAWGNLAQGLGALALTVAMPMPSIALAYTPEDAVPEWMGSVRDWQKEQLTAIVGGIVGTPDQWEEDPVAAGTYAVASIGTMFIPVAGAASAGTKAASVLSRVGLASEKLAVIAGEGTRVAGGLAHAGDIMGSLAKTVDRFSGGTVNLTDTLERATTTMRDIPEVAPGILTHADPPAQVHVDAAEVTVGAEPAVATHSLGVENPVIDHPAGGGDFASGHGDASGSLLPGASDGQGSVTPHGANHVPDASDVGPGSPSLPDDAALASANPPRTGELPDAAYGPRFEDSVYANDPSMVDYHRLGELTEAEFAEKYFDGVRATTGYTDWNWPGNDGFDGPTAPNTLMPGEVIERIGGSDGNFAALEDTPFPMKGLPPDRLGLPVVSYEVLKPLPPNVLEGLTKGWFEQPGGGWQYYFPKPFQEYLDQGYLK